MNENNNIGAISGDEYSLCQKMFKILHCNALWIMKSDGYSLTVLVSDNMVWKHYWDKKCYLVDPNIKDINLVEGSKPNRRIDLGTDQAGFKENGFLYDLYKLFNVEEFISIEKQKGKSKYCFRFFTNHNRFLFANQVLNTIPIIGCFMNSMIERCRLALDQQPSLNLLELH